MADRNVDTSEHRLTCWWVVLTAFFFRSAVLACSLAGIGPLGQLDQDPDSYRQIAETLSETGTYGIQDADGRVDVTAFRPPLYPWILSWLTVEGRIPNVSIALLHACLGAATAGLTYTVVYRLTFERGGNLRGWIAAGLVTVDPLLVMQSSRVMTETIAVFLFVATWWAVVYVDEALRITESRNAGRRADVDVKAKSGVGGGWLLGILLLGSLLALGFLCRPIFLVWAAFLCGWWVVRCWTCQASALRCGSMIAAMLLPIVITLACWTARNSKQLGHPVWATTHGGYTLLLGNNPSFYEYLEAQSWMSAAFSGMAWDDTEFQAEWRRRQADIRSQHDAEALADARDLELQLNDAAKNWAKETIRQQPRTFSYACTVRLARLWSPLARIGGSVGLLSWIIAAYYTLLMLIVVLRLVKQRWSILWRSEMAGLLFAIALSCVHLIYWSNARMRAPIVPFLAAMVVISAPMTGRRGGE